jgi:hypothetical protein
VVVRGRDGTLEAPLEVVVLSDEGEER